MVAPKFNKLGWQEKAGESAEERQLRPLLAGALARAGDAAAIEHGRALFKRYLDKPDSVSPALRDFALEVAAREADSALYEQLVARAVQADSSEERERISFALAGATDPALAKRTLQLALSPALPAQLTNQIVPAVAQNGHQEQAWEFAVANRKILLKNQDAVSRNGWFPSLVGGSSNPADADMMEAYVAAHFGADAQIEAKRVGNAIRTRAQEKKRLLPQLRAALK